MFRLFHLSCKAAAMSQRIESLRAKTNQLATVMLHAFNFPHDKTKKLIEPSRIRAVPCQIKDQSHSHSLWSLTLFFPMWAHTHTHTQDHDRKRRRCHTPTPAFLNSFICSCWVSVEVPTAFFAGMNGGFSQSDAPDAPTDSVGRHPFHF